MLRSLLGSYRSDRGRDRRQVSRQELTGALQKLKSALERRSALDQELRGLLDELAADIHDALHGDEEREAPPRSLLERAEALEVRFAARNPEIEGVLRETVEALARMGI